jgi:glycosyltransferase involved in cell wall biosynthesis
VLTIVLPVYNREKILPQTLASLLLQTSPADEILVIDDGSTDRTAEVAESYPSPVRVIRQANQGPSAARNRGLEEAKGDWVHFFDSDDLALPNLHAVQLSALDRSGADIAYSPIVKCAISPRGIYPTAQIQQYWGLPKGNLVHALLTNWSVLPICSLIRTSLARQVGGFPSDLRVGEDQFFFLRLLLAGAQVVHSRASLVLYRADNVDKLSDSASNQLFLLHWARFLLLARQECLRSGLDPATWFDFRLRVWDARVSLASQHEICDQTLLEALRHVEMRSPWPQWFYPLRRMIRRKGGGLTWRMFGRRAHRCFRSAPVSLSQLTEMQRLSSVVYAPAAQGYSTDFGDDLSKPY